MRYFIHLAFHGANYAGWQIQPNAPSVQQTLNEALSTLLRQEIYVVGAGRTDAGVHAKEMYAHFEVAETIDETDLTFRLNRLLPKDIVVYSVFLVNDDAHTRFSATSRSYEYIVTHRKNPFLEGLAWYVEAELDVDAMNDAAQLLLGEKDFGSFARSRTQTKTNICNLTQAVWEQKDDVLVFSISANRFLRNMVRAIVGTLVAVGKNNCTKARFEEILLAKDRTLAGESAPAHGLYLTRVVYPPEIKQHG